MSQNEITSQTNSPENDWKTLAEYRLPSVAGNERQAVKLLEEAVSRLNIPADRLERLKTAVAEATMNATEHGNRYQADLPVAIRVLVSGQSMAVEITDFGQGGPIGPAEQPDIEAKLRGAQTTRGWGFFLIQKMVDSVQVDEDDAHHTILLYLYLEGHPESKNAGCEPGQEETQEE